MRNNIKRGKYLKDRREELGINQIDLAKKLNLERSNISKWEAGENISDTNIEKLCSYLKISKKALFYAGFSNFFDRAKTFIKINILKIIIIILSVLCLALSHTFFYYINNHNTITYYSITSTENNYININNSNFFRSKDKVILNLHIDYLIDIKDIKNIKLFIADKDKINYFDVLQPLEFITINDNFNTQEYFSFKKLDYSIENMGIEIECYDGTIDRETLFFKEEYRNSKSFIITKNKSIPNINLKEKEPDSNILKNINELSNKKVEVVKVKYNDIEYTLFNNNNVISINYIFNNRVYELEYINLDNEYFASIIVINNKSKSLYDYSITDKKCLSNNCNNFEKDFELFSKIIDLALKKQ